jgi:hypothetical protein
MTGAAFAVLLTVANGQGGTLSDSRDVVASAALSLLIPFAVYLGALLRTNSITDTDRWLAVTAIAASTAGATLKLMSGAPETALSHAPISAQGQTAAAMTALADSTTLLALFPLALFCLAVGAGALRTRTLPRWLGVGALIAGASLAVNGCFRGTENVPALLLMALWCLLVSIHLTRAAVRGAPTHLLEASTAA